MSKTEPKNKNIVGQQLRYWRTKRGLNFYQLAQKIGRDQGYLKRVEMAEIPNPGIGIISELAAALEIPIEYLLKPLTAEQTKPNSRDLGEELREIFERITPKELGFLGNVIRIPVKGGVPAGQLCMREEENGEFLLMTKSMLGPFIDYKDLFALRIDGDSLEGDGIYSGDHVLVLPVREIDVQNKIYILKDPETQECVARHASILDDKRILLESSNPQYKPMVVNSVEILGRIVYVLPPGKEV